MIYEVVMVQILFLESSALESHYWEETSKYKNSAHS